MAELMVGQAQYLAFYNSQRPHHSLGYQTRDTVYKAGGGGGALIVDLFGDDETPEEVNSTGPGRAAEEVKPGTA